jgi:hypothetical protein
MPHGLNEGTQTWQLPSFKPCGIAMFVYLRSSRAALPCVYTFVQSVCYCHVCMPSFKPCVRYTNMAITHNLNEGIQTWQCRTAWTKVYKHGNNTRLLPCLYTFVQAVRYCHVCIPSFKPCGIAMFVYLRSSRAALQCVYTFVQSLCYCHVYTNMAIRHSLTEGIQTWQ